MKLEYIIIHKNETKRYWEAQVKIRSIIYFDNDSPNISSSWTRLNKIPDNNPMKIIKGFDTHLYIVFATRGFPALFYPELVSG